MDYAANMESLENPARSKDVTPAVRADYVAIMEQHGEPCSIKAGGAVWSVRPLVSRGCRPVPPHASCMPGACMRTYHTKYYADRWDLPCGP